MNGPPDLTYRAWLVHELTHIWQYQRGRTVPELALDALGGDYDYGGEQGLRDAAAQGKRFGDFNYEEQGDILRDYYRNGSAARTFRPTSRSSTRSGSGPRTACSRSPCRRLARLSD